MVCYSGIALAAWLAPAASVVAADEQTISLFILPAFSRHIHGQSRSLDLAAGGHALGNAEAFFGVDALSDASRQYLTSGVRWQTKAHDRLPFLQLSALQTEARDDSFGGQTLVHAESRLNLGGRWYMPDIKTEIDQVSDSGDTTSVLGGRAARLGFTNTIGAATYNLDYFRADPQFNALGSDIVAGDRGLELSSQYILGNAWQLSSRVGLHQPIISHIPPRLVSRWVIQRQPRSTDIGSPWRLTARLGSAAAAPEERTPIAIELAAETARWRSWRIDSALGWYSSYTTAPQDLPVAGALWQVSASRGLDIAGLTTELSPSFSIGGSRYDDRALASRTGISLGFPTLMDNINFQIDYLSTGWGPNAAQGDIQMSLHYTQNAATLLPILVSATHGLRLPWQPHY